MMLMPMPMQGRLFMRLQGAIDLFLRLAPSMALALALLPATAAPRYGATVSRVSDGDTLWVKPAGGGEPRKLRIQGIDAPELCQPGGADSRRALEHLVANRKLEVIVSRKDDYGRSLASIRVAGRDVGAVMVSQGQAWSYRWHRNPGPYAAEESGARQARRGLFAHPGAERPRDFRQRHGPCPHPGK